MNNLYKSTITGKIASKEHWIKGFYYSLNYPEDLIEQKANEWFNRRLKDGWLVEYDSMDHVVSLNLGD